MKCASVAILFVLLTVRAVETDGYTVPTFYKVGFDTAMNRTSKVYRKKYRRPYAKKALQTLKKLFEAHHPYRVKPSKEPVIPKKIHQIWVGPKPLPKRFEHLQATWQAMHPDWEYKLWTDADVVGMKLHNRELYDSTQDYREKADLLRKEILYREGGLYVDCDFECLKPFDHLHHCYNFYIGIASNDVPEMVANGLMASVPGHPILKQAIENVSSKPTPDWRNRSGVFYFSRQFVKAIRAKGSKRMRAIALPVNFLYPLGYRFNKQTSLRTVIRPETMGLHYWANSKGSDWEPVRLVQMH